MCILLSSVFDEFFPDIGALDSFFALESGICSAFLWLTQFSVDSLQTAAFTTLLILLRAAALLTVDASRAGRANVIHRLRSLFWLIVFCLLGASLKYAAMR